MPMHHPSSLRRPRREVPDDLVSCPPTLNLRKASGKKTLKFVHELVEISPHLSEIDTTDESETQGTSRLTETTSEELDMIQPSSPKRFLSRKTVEKKPVRQYKSGKRTTFVDDEEHHKHHPPLPRHSNNSGSTRSSSSRRVPSPRNTRTTRSPSPRQEGQRSNRAPSQRQQEERRTIRSSSPRHPSPRQGIDAPPSPRTTRRAPSPVERDSRHSTTTSRTTHRAPSPAKESSHRSSSGRHSSRHDDEASPPPSPSRKQRQSEQPTTRKHRESSPAPRSRDQHRSRHSSHRQQQRSPSPDRVKQRSSNNHRSHQKAPSRPVHPRAPPSRGRRSSSVYSSINSSLVSWDSMSQSAYSVFTTASMIARRPAWGHYVVGVMVFTGWMFHHWYFSEYLTHRPLYVTDLRDTPLSPEDMLLEVHPEQVKLPSMLRGAMKETAVYKNSDYENRNDFEPVKPVAAAFSTVDEGAGVPKKKEPTVTSHKPAAAAVVEKKEPTVTSYDPAAVEKKAAPPVVEEKKEATASIDEEDEPTRDKARREQSDDSGPPPPVEREEAATIKPTERPDDDEN